jgi:DNA topoisomerase-1
MSKILVIVESPSKITKIQSYLGDKYIVAASMGHITEIPKTKNLCIDINDNYKPHFEIAESKKSVFANIKKLYKECGGNILMGSDFDREGNGVAWHIFNLLNVKPENRKRIIFNEITEKAIKEAIKNPKLIDTAETNSYLARVVADRLLGYKLTEIVWKSTNNYTISCGRVMSVVIKMILSKEADISKFQSQAYYKLESNFVLDKKDLNKSTKNVILAVCDENIKDKNIVEKLYKICSENKTKFSIKSLDKKISTRNGPLPLTTASLQQLSSIKLGFSPDHTMRLAQKLYEASYITYMRTDSIAIAEDAMKQIKTCVENKFGKEYYKRNDSKSVAKNTQLAHECIRPTDFTKENINLGTEGLTEQHNRLYKLIFRQTISSQMVPAQIEIRTVKIITDGLKKEKLTFSSKTEKILFEGFLKAQNMHKYAVKRDVNGELIINEDVEEEEEEEVDEDDINNEDQNNEDSININIKPKHNKYLETLFDDLKENQEVFSQSMNCIEKHSKSAGRYTEASLIKQMSILGIGRPSSSANILAKIQAKGYIELKSIPAKNINISVLKYIYPDTIKIEIAKGKIPAEKNKLFGNSLSIMVTDFLEKNFTNIMNYEYTSNLETKLDSIAENKTTYYDVIHELYTTLMPIIDTLHNDIKLLKSADPKADTSSRRMLGTNPVTTNPIVAIKSRSGYLIVEENPIKKDSRFASFSSNFEEMTLETALGLLIYPKTLPKYKDVDIIIKKAKNVYISYGNANYSIENYVKANQKNSNAGGNPNNINNVFIDDENITFEEAKRIIDYYEKSKLDKAENAKQDKVMNDNITIKKGPYGYYIKLDGTINIKLPKKYSKDIDNITLEQCLEVVEKHKATPPKGSRAARFGVAGKQKAKEKKEKKEKKAKETVESTETTEPKTPKKTRAPKAKKAEPKTTNATIESILEPEVEQVDQVEPTPPKSAKVRKPKQKKEKINE